MENNAAPKKLKWRLNVFDIIIICVAVAVAVFVLRPSSGGGIVSPGTRETVVYTLLLTDMPPEAAKFIKEGDPLMDKIEKRPIGSVVSAKLEPSKTQMEDAVNGRYVMPESPSGKLMATVVVKADATVTESEISVGGFIVRCGAEVSVTGPLFAGSGYITDIERSGEQSEKDH